MAHLLVVDDQASTAEGTAALLADIGHDATVCVWLEDLAGLQAAHHQSPFDAVLLDLVFVGQRLDVLDALHTLAFWTPPPPVVILTAGGESRRHFIEDALDWPSVRGGVPKNAPAETLQRCVERVLAGGEHYDHEIAAYRPASHRPPTEDLLGRDARIWFALARGLTSHKAIAADIGCRPKTVQNAVRRMGDMLASRGLTTNPQPTLSDLVHYAARHHEYFAAMERRATRTRAAAGQ